MWNSFLARILVVMVLGSGYVSTSFADWEGGPGFKQAEPANLTVYMNQLVHTQTPRNYKNVDELNRLSAWIKEQMRLFGIPCEYQTYTVKNNNYRNVVCKLNVGRANKVVIGAHYDTFENLPGADGNASGVAGVLETARILAAERSALKNNVEFVFYTLKEYPFFKTAQMGSYVHARSLQPQKEQIKAVFILDMIGYFDLKNVQDYPPGLKWIYPSHGNFIATLSNFESRELGSAYCEAMKRLNQLDCQRIVAPSFLAGVDFSDHFNYWQLGLPAVLITDTAFYRNKAYHTAEDRIDRLNTIKMAQTLNGLVYTLLNNAF